ncbi:MAG TPA: methyl-accepting chemotaxis protein [Spirochaetota bacterium]|nr:methyl-accepting chemotaxis protein [Spirochaetota bacterium]
MYSLLISVVLDKYKDKSYMVQQKARILLYMIGILAVIVLMITVALNLTMENSFLSGRNAVRFLILLLLAVAYAILRSGNYALAANLAIFGSLAAMGTQIVLADFKSGLDFSNRLHLLHIFIIITALFSSRRASVFAMFISIGIAAAAGLNSPALAPAEIKGTLVGFSESLVIITVASIILMKMVDETIRRIEASMKTEQEHSVMKNLLNSGLELSRNLADLSEGLNAENRNLSQWTVEHASALEEVTATIEETVAAIRKNTENTDQASRLAAESTRIADEGARMIVEAVDFIRDIDASGEKISQITAVINEIAFQTNILALNASIEAARAGSAGKGFAVVANEVRNLAKRAADAAKEISGLIDQSLSRIHHGTELVSRSGGALSEICTSIRGVDAVVQDITRQSDEQQRSIEEIRISLTQMDEVVQENSALVEKTSAVSDSLSRQARDLMAMLQNAEVFVKA